MQSAMMSGNMIETLLTDLITYSAPKRKSWTAVKPWSSRSGTWGVAVYGRFG